jgi:hypothetical protein
VALPDVEVTTSLSDTGKIPTALSCKKNNLLLKVRSLVNLSHIEYPHQVDCL